jgi:hypothetical protein
MTAYKSTSNYRKTSINDLYLDHYVPPVIVNPENTRKITLEQKYEKRPDLLAYDLYGDSDLWWVFTIYNRNKILNPIYDFKEGMTIRVPNSISAIGV